MREIRWQFPQPGTAGSVSPAFLQRGIKGDLSTPASPLPYRSFPLDPRHGPIIQLVNKSAARFPLQRFNLPPDRASEGYYLTGGIRTHSSRGRIDKEAGGNDGRGKKDRAGSRPLDCQSKNKF